MITDAEQPLRADELAELRRYAGKRIRLWRKRALYSTLARLLSCASVYPFLAGHALHEHLGFFREVSRPVVDGTSASVRDLQRVLVQCVASPPRFRKGARLNRKTMTLTGKFALINAAVCGMLAKYYFWDHTPVRLLLIAAPASLVILNVTVWVGVRSAAKRKARLQKQS